MLLKDNKGPGPGRLDHLIYTQMAFQFSIKKNF
jgi:hypothetical protein